VSIVDGAASLATGFFGMSASGQWLPERGSNVLDSGAPHYDVYACSCGGYISIGPIEARFFADLLRRLVNGSEIKKPRAARYFRNFVAPDDEYRNGV